MNASTRASLRGWLALVGLLTACHGSDGGSPFLAPGVNDIGGSMAFTVDQGLLVGQLFEGGVDRNGDGDGVDELLRIVDLASGNETFVPGLAFVDGPSVQGGVVPFLVAESEARRDLNGDGDTDDLVLHVRDRKGRIVSLGVATFGFLQAGALIAFGISEAQENEDIDLDGQLSSQIAAVYDADRGKLTSLRIAVHPEGTRMAGRKIVWVGNEQGSGDLNGDGDEFDAVVLVYDADTGVLRDTGHAILGLLAEGSVLALLESESGDRDLNGNGSALDVFVELCDLDTGAFRTTDAQTAGLVAVGGDLAVFNLISSQVGLGTWVYDRWTDALLPLPAVPFTTLVTSRALRDRRFAFLLDEQFTGLDLDGDGELRDQVPQVFDARTGVTVSSGRAAFSPPQLDEHQMVFLGPPLSSPEPPPPMSLQVQDLRTGLVHDTGLPAMDFRLEGERIVALVPEAWVGADLDGDLDTLDRVVEVLDLRTGSTFDTGLALDSFEFDSIELDGNVLVLNVGDRLKAVRLP